MPLLICLLVFLSSQDLFFIKALFSGMPRTEVTAVSVISFQINSWHAQLLRAGEFSILKQAYRVIKSAFAFENDQNR